MKAVFVEGFIRTLLDLIKEPMYIEDKACWLNHIIRALDRYDNRVHHAIRMTPFEASNDKLIPNLIPKLPNNNLPKTPKKNRYLYGN